MVVVPQRASIFEIRVVAFVSSFLTRAMRLAMRAAILG